MADADPSAVGQRDRARPRMRDDRHPAPAHAGGKPRTVERRAGGDVDDSETVGAADGHARGAADRRESRLPVLMLTARGEDEDRIIGLELGADDYLPKPFNTRELVARVRAIMRRLEERRPGVKFEVNGISIDPGTRDVTRDGTPVEVTTFEFDILETLMRAAGRVVSRDDLMEELYGRKATPFDRSVDMHISHLRKKLEGDKPLIKTVRGVGYQFVRSPEEGVAA